jgi:protein-tyrosine kinase
MSRIHEALKKAEQERTSSVVTEAAAAPPAPAPVATEWEAAQPAVASAPVSALVPGVSARADFLRFEDLRAHGAHPAWQIDPNVNVFFNPLLSAHGAEQFRTLRSRLYQIRGTQTLHTLLVTSSVPGEGKTFVTTNLAQAIVRQPDRRALVIDADLRRPRVHTLLGAPSSPGLTDYLRGEVDEMAILQHAQEGNLCFIPGGSEVTNPSELLLNGRLKKLVDRLAPVFDWIILDSPPCLPVADATILADVCDGVLLVVRAGSTPSSTGQRACQEMKGKNVLGVVLNAVEESHMYGTYYYQGGTYGAPYGASDPKTQNRPEGR